jgi:hypothetical protein
MSPLRWDVLLVGFVLAVPVLALGLRGDLTPEETMNRVLWCLGAGWAAVALIRWAATPRRPAPTPRRTDDAATEDAGAAEDEEHSPAP